MLVSEEGEKFKVAFATIGQFKYFCAGADNDNENSGGVGKFWAGDLTEYVEARRTQTRVDTRDARFHLLSNGSPTARSRHRPPSRQESVGRPDSRQTTSLRADEPRPTEGEVQLVGH